MSPSEHPFHRYTRTLLPFHAHEAPEALPSPLPPEVQDRALERMVRAGTRGAGGRVLLLGLGAGVLARELRRRLPEETPLVVAELHPGRLQTLLRHAPDLLDWWRPTGASQVLADTTPWSLLLLLHASGGLEGLVPLRNPELQGSAGAARYGLLQKTLVLARERHLPTAPSPGAAPSVSAAAILHPEEPGLQEFLDQFPAWLHEVVLVWDADATPEHGLRCAAPLRELARQLAGDFAAQRNCMLDACRGDWLLYLDCDERLSAAAWQLVPGLVRQPSLEGYWFPRRTFYPDAGHVMAGMGLWPDLQLRLFRNQPGLRFSGRVHERLKGVEGAVAVAVGLPVMHLNQLNKDAALIDEKYALFNRSGGLSHVRSQDYPHLPLPYFENMEQACGPHSLLLLRYNPGG